MNECGERPVKGVLTGVGQLWAADHADKVARRSMGRRKEGTREGRRKTAGGRKNSDQKSTLRINKRLQKNKTRFICLRPEFVPPP